MDEASLPDIANLLSATIGASTRGATCAAIAACSSGEGGASLRKLLGTTEPGETIIRRLLILCADSKCTRLALSALVNISEDEQAAASLTRAGAVERSTEALLDAEQRPFTQLYSGLLSNLTRFPFGVDAIVGKGKGKASAQVSLNTLFRLVTIIDQIPNVLWMSNACSTPEGRAALLLKGDQSSAPKNDDAVKQDPSRQPLTWLLRLLASKEDSTRLAAASALRNCAMAEDCHETLVNRTNAIGTCLAQLMSPSQPIPFEELKDAPFEVKNFALNPLDAKPEMHVEIRLMLVESLLLLCKTEVGREALQNKSAYPVLKEWLQVEENEQVRETVNNLIDRISAVEDGTPVEDILSNNISVVET